MRTFFPYRRAAAFTIHRQAPTTTKHGIPTLNKNNDLNGVGTNN